MEAELGGGVDSQPGRRRASGKFFLWCPKQQNSCGFLANALEAAPLWLCLKITLEIFKSGPGVSHHQFGLSSWFNDASSSLATAFSWGPHCCSYARPHLSPSPFQKALGKCAGTTPSTGIFLTLGQSHQLSLCLWQTSGATDLGDAALTSVEVCDRKRVRCGA